METLISIIQILLGNNKQAVACVSTNTMADIMQELQCPVVKAEKTPLQVFQDLFYKESLLKLEVEMLKMQPNKNFAGSQVWYSSTGSKFSDWVPCTVRPEVEYCCYGKN